MKRNEKIEKLERLGIFNQWKYTQKEQMIHLILSVLTSQ